jgi:hypothetical protein
MTDSIFDPTGPNTERSGNRYMGPDAANISHMPPDVTDGRVEAQPGEPDESTDTDAIADAEAQVEERADQTPDKTRPDV